MKNYPQILSSIDTKFAIALQQLKSDPLFSSSQFLYTDDDKVRIAKYWKEILIPFQELQKIIRGLDWRSFLNFGNKDIFIVKYSAIVTYYNMVYELQATFGPHEEFLRQYLDDTFPENYSTLARFMYHVRFYSILSYPHEYFLTLRDEVNPSLGALFDRPQKYVGDIEKRWRHDMINIWYYIRYRLSLLLTWISKNGGRIMAHIHLKNRTIGLISLDHIRIVENLLTPGDILLSRTNWCATNLNIPGFWKHMAMYIGTGRYVKENFHIRTSDTYIDDDHYVIEAVGTGVRIIPFEEFSIHNDYLGVVRPRFSSEKKFRAISKILSLIGKSYDYSFNFYSDVNYVCSTLVTKSYLPESKNDEGIHITLTRIGTGITYPPNDLVKKMKSEIHIPELDFVAFIDANEKQGKSFLAQEQDFLLSGERSRFSFFLD